MTIDNEPVIDTDVEEVDTVENDTPPEGVPIPGMDIFTVVERSIMQQAVVGPAPQYAFIRNDIYLLVMTAHTRPGFMRWVDESKGLNCVLLPFNPMEGQNQFKLAYSYEEACEVYVSTFPEGTFSYLPPTQANLDATPEPDACTVVETNNG